VDDDLLDRLQLGDPAAFDDLVVQYHRAVYDFAYRLTHDRATAEDVAQDVFVRAYRGLGGFRRASSLKTWLFRIAIRVASDARPEVSARTTLAPPLTVEPDALAALEQSEREAELARAMARLSGKQRATLVLRVAHDLPFREIAEVMGAPLGTVKATYHQAVSRLRELVGNPRPVPKVH
jgi:RNA polymerase sigma-70 factor (ECF subfamily)